MAKILSKFGEQQLVMVNYACGFNQSKAGKYFERIIIRHICGNCLCLGDFVPMRTLCNAYHKEF